MTSKRPRRKKGIQELGQDDLQLLNIYKQAYKRYHEDVRSTGVPAIATKPANAVDPEFS